MSTHTNTLTGEHTHTRRPTPDAKQYIARVISRLIDDPADEARDRRELSACCRTETEMVAALSTLKTWRSAIGASSK